jgi:hypothetical protein
MLDDLHQLIHTFTPDEVGSLNRYIQQDGSQQNFIYQSLFSFLYEAGPAYEEEQIDDFCAKNNLNRESLRVHCYHLYRKVMFYLRDPETRSTPQWKIQCLLQDAETLHLKALFNLAKKTLTKALKLAIECQLPEWEYKVHLAFSEILIKQSSTLNLSDADEHLKQAEQLWERVKQSEHYAQIYVHIFLQWLQKSSSPDKLADQLALDNREIPEQLSLPAKLKYAQCRTMFAQLNNHEKGQMVYWQKKSHDLFIENPSLKSHYLNYYLAFYENYFMAALMSKDQALIADLFKNLDSLEPHDPFVISRLEATKVYSRLAFWLSDNQTILSIGVEEIDRLLDQFESHEKVIIPSRREAINYNIGFFFFLRGQTTETQIRWSDLYEISKANLQRPDRQRLIILLLLLNDYQTPGFDATALLTRVDSTRSRLRTWNTNAVGLEEHEKITIRHLRKLINLPERDKSGKLKQLKKWEAELQAYVKDSNESQLHRTDAILKWLEIKIQEIKPL